MKTLIISCLLAFSGFLLLAPASVSAYDVINNGGICSQAQGSAVCQDAQANSCASGSSCQSSDPVIGIIGTVTEIIAIVAGIVAVIMIIVAGFRFIVSGGEAQAVAGAKKSLLSAIIGVAVIALASAIISFVMGQL